MIEKQYYFSHFILFSRMIYSPKLQAGRVADIWQIYTYVISDMALG
jgi:hypothetical protein